MLWLQPKTQISLSVHLYSGVPLIARGTGGLGFEIANDEAWCNFAVSCWHWLFQKRHWVLMKTIIFSLISPATWYLFRTLLTWIILSKIQVPDLLPDGCPVSKLPEIASAISAWGLTIVSLWRLLNPAESKRASVSVAAGCNERPTYYIIRLSGLSCSCTTTNVEKSNHRELTLQLALSSAW